MEKLSSGYRINRSADDAAGLTISEKMRWQIRGLDKASQNIADGMSLLQVADGALNESHAVLQRMNELAVQAANDTNTDVDRDAIQLEMDELSEELTRIAETTSFNSEIYPLASDGVQKVQWPSGLTEVSLTIVNDSGNDVVCNGVTYKSGETMVVNNVAWLEGGYRRSTMLGMFCVMPDGSYERGIYGTSISDYQQTHSVSTLFSYQLGFPEYKKEFFYATLKDVQADENGYLYIVGDACLPYANSTRWYLQQSDVGIMFIMTNGRLDEPLHRRNVRLEIF